MRIVALYRVSTEAQERDGASLDAQQRACREICARQGWDLVEELRGHESATGGDRTLLRAALDAVRGGGISAIWVYEQSRLTRGDELDVAVLLRELRERGCAVVVGHQVRDLGDIDARFAWRIQGVVDRYESERIRERVRRGAQEKARQGKKASGASPYGYRNPPKGDPRRGTLQVVPDEAAVVRRIFGHVAAGTSLAAVARGLNADGVPSARGGIWHAGAVRRVLANPTHRGAQFSGLFRPVPGRRYHDIDLTHADAIVVEGAHEAIVSPELWHAANQRAADGATRAPGTPRLLTGLLYIEGRRAVGDFTGGKSYYAPVGGGPWIQVSEVEPLAWHGLGVVVSTPELIEALIAAARDRRRDDELAAGIAGIEERARRLRRRLDGLVDMRADGELDAATFADRASRTRAEIQDAEARARDLRSAQRSQQPDALRQAAAAVRAVLGRRLNTDQRRRALAAVVGRIDVTLREHKQGRSRAGGFAATPRRKVHTMDFQLRYGGSDTTRSRCDRSPATVRVVRDGDLVTDLGDVAHEMRRRRA